MKNTGPLVFSIIGLAVFMIMSGATVTANKPEKSGEENDTEAEVKVATFGLG